MLLTVHPLKWADELKERTNYLITKSSKQEIFTSEILKIIIETRKSKKLSEVEIVLNI